MPRKYTSQEEREAAAEERAANYVRDQRRRAGRRLWTTGGYHLARVLSYCTLHDLLAQETIWVVEGWRDAIVSDEADDWRTTREPRA